MRAFATAARLRGRRDEGAGTLEYIGMCLIAAFLVLALATTLIASNPSVREAARRGICQILTLGMGDCGSGGDAIDRVPREPCIVSSDGGEISLSVGLVAFGEGGEIYLIEKLGDGTYRVTEGIAIAGGAQGGAGGKLEITIDDQEYGGKAGLSGSAKVGIKVGNTYEAGSLEEAEELLGRMRQDTIKNSGGLVGVVVELFGSPDLPPPDSVWIEAGEELNGSASADLTGVELGVTAEIEAAIGTQFNKDGTSTVYLSGTMSGEASVGIGYSLMPESKGKGAKPDELDFSQIAVETGVSGEAGITIQVDYDNSGQVTAVRTIGTLGWTLDNLSATILGQDLLPGEDEGTTTDTTIELPITSDADREIAADMLAAMGIPFVPGLSDKVRAPGVYGGVDAAVDAAIAFGQAARDRGRLWTDEYTHDESTRFGLDIQAAIGGKANLGGSWVTNGRTGISQKYFDGVGFVTREGCAA